ncbi:permease YjgP/YjgQ family protein [Alkalidesulfovibrio alkalitolerans DSM 16529]|uniref:Permease YjgP/YjgQ family protein n=1 Tax=Alkalidesulfovibrio alkalitolerans DSM 16529 TaxID=1121439 RepID=S7T1H2_9BACT|nr:LptF/LptG family permease [Alkalidesulfovibrio alkalitolerans]EPR30391.1 permease YjgP/YjgQ family protein [Alkalidesulfovibrio alkalitolerans DSM 16529]
MLTTLGRYLLRNNLFLMIVCMGLGVFIYLLSDMFDRLDQFINAGLGIDIILLYFGAKVPLIISQIMPAVFLIAMVVQLSVMERSRELLALQTGGVSYGRLAVFFVIYAIVWSGIQLGFSQHFGVLGERTSSRIWAEDVRERQVDRETIHDIWFRDDRFIVFFREADVGRGEGTRINIWQLSEDHQSLVWTITAPRFSAGRAGWTLYDAQSVSSARFETRHTPTLHLHIEQDLQAFAVVGPAAKPTELPVWQLGSAIESLRRTGSNVEALRTAYWEKWAYAFSILSMALLAMAVSSYRANIYVNITVSLVATFAFYGLMVMGATMGATGMVSPIVGAWAGNVIVSLASVSRLVWVTSKH